MENISRRFFIVGMSFFGSTFARAANAGKVRQTASNAVNTQADGVSVKDHSSGVVGNGTAGAINMHDAYTNGNVGFDAGFTAVSHGGNPVNQTGQGPGSTLVSTQARTVQATRSSAGVAGNGTALAFDGAEGYNNGNVGIRLGFNSLDNN